MGFFVSSADRSIGSTPDRVDSWIGHDYIAPPGAYCRSLLSVGTVPNPSARPITISSSAHPCSFDVNCFCRAVRQATLAAPLLARASGTPCPPTVGACESMPVLKVFWSSPGSAHAHRSSTWRNQVHGSLLPVAANFFKRTQARDHSSRLPGLGRQPVGS